MTSLAGLGPGDRVGPFLIERKLGGGGMGMVFEAVEENLQRRVALKLISPSLAHDQEFRERFTREAQAQAALDSAHVVQVYSHGEADNTLYIATQLIPGGDLGELVQEYGPPPIETSLDLIAQIADGLGDAHDVGLVHRDIKPANVLIRKRRDKLTAYLADFGIARQVNTEYTRTGFAIGTPSYMAPELHTGGQAGVSSDIYALGCLLWACLTGHAPYAGTTEFQLIKAHMEQQIPQLTGPGQRTHEVNRILRTALAKRPEERYRSAAEMRDDLRRTASIPDTGPILPAAEVTHAQPIGQVESRAPGQSPGQGPPQVGPPPIQFAGVPPGPQPPPFQTPVMAHSPKRPSNKGLMWGMVGMIVVMVILGGVALAASGMFDGGGGGGDPTVSDDTVPPSASHEEVAVDSISVALEKEGMTEQEADCAAKKWVDLSGLEKMRDAGMLDENYQYVESTASSSSGDMDVALDGVNAMLQCSDFSES